MTWDRGVRGGYPLPPPRRMVLDNHADELRVTLDETADGAADQTADEHQEHMCHDVVVAVRTVPCRVCQHVADDAPRFGPDCGSQGRSFLP